MYRKRIERRLNKHYTIPRKFYRQKHCCGQSYKAFMNVNYNYRVVHKSKLLIFTTLGT